MSSSSGESSLTKRTMSTILQRTCSCNTIKRKSHPCFLMCACAWKMGDSLDDIRAKVHADVTTIGVITPENADKAMIEVREAI